jgi:prenyltransferase beta subunit
MKSLKHRITKKNRLKLFVAVSLGLVAVCLFIYFSNLRKPLTVEEAWQRIYDEDTLIKPHPNKIKEYFDEENYVSYVKKIQTDEGYFLHDSPMVYETFEFSEILNCIGERPTDNTINYIKSLQVGTIGFAETSGETPWTSKANLGVPLFVWFGVPVEKKDGVISFFQNFQKDDGGFASIINSFSTVEDTLNTINILSYLGGKPKDVEGATRKIKSYYQTNKIDVFKYAEALENIGYNFSKEERVGLIQKINSLCKFDPKSETLEKIFNCLKTLQDFDEDIEKYKFLTENLTIRNDAYFNSALCKINKLYNSTNKLHDDLLSFVRKNELPQGGFKSDSTYVLENSFTQQTMFLLGRLNDIDNDKLTEWLLSVRNDDGWGGLPHSSTYHVYTSNAIISLRISNKTIPNRDGILNRVENEVSRELVDNSNYNALRGIKEIFDRWMLIKEEPKDVEKLVGKVLSFWNKDGGFGNPDFSYAYATEWGVRSIYMADRFLTYRGIPHENWLEKIKEKTANWLRSDQNADGGFGVTTGQPSNMQSTFLAIRSLYLLGERPSDVDKAIRWIASHQKEDGGFSGTLTTSSDLLFTYYSVGSLIMLDEMKGGA